MRQVSIGGRSRALPNLAWVVPQPSQSHAPGCIALQPSAPVAPLTTMGRLERTGDSFPPTVQSSGQSKVAENLGAGNFCFRFVSRFVSRCNRRCASVLIVMDSECDIILYGNCDTGMYPYPYLQSKTSAGYLGSRGRASEEVPLGWSQCYNPCRSLGIRFKLNLHLHSFYIHIHPYLQHHSVYLTLLFASNPILHPTH